MPPYIVTPLLSVLGALLVAGLIAWIRKPRLTYWVPKLFTKNNISDHGQLAEITIFNRGFGNEEDIVVTLNPKLKYEIVGSTTRELQLNENKLVCPRLGSNTDITVILTIEGGSFSQSDIESCLSKGTTGFGVTSLAEVPSSGHEKIASVVLFILGPLLIFLFFWGVGKLINPDELEAKASAAQNSATRAEGEAAKAISAADQALSDVKEIAAGRNRIINDWKVPAAYYTSPDKLFLEFEREAISVKVGDATRSGKSDVVMLPVLVKNLSDVAIKYNFSATNASSDADSRTPPYERRVSEVFVAPGASSTQRIKLILPRNSIDPSERTIWVEAFIEDSDGNTLSISQIIKAKED